mmetsp:Transcript_16821/g.20620  ORF Transcript_16821/g.20620 Transcript_16821/m.20620 type:complete len:292 (+) Transcript_16821:77-952(+)
MLRSLRQLAIRILKTPEAEEKCRLTREAVEAYRSGKIIQIVGNNEEELPEKPARAIEEIRAGTIKKSSGVKAYLHSVTHAECCAIDCFWDLLARFGPQVEDALGSERARLFADDVLSIALEESTHFERLSTRLLEGYGTKYGDLEAHDTLAESMLATNDDILARLVIVHLVHEARGLDVFDMGRKRLVGAGDTSTAKVLEANYAQEIGHVKAMHSWFVTLAEHRGLDPRDTFAFHIRDPARWRAQGLKPPFNHQARAAAGLDQDWYLPLTLVQGQEGGKKSKKKKEESIRN